MQTIYDDATLRSALQQLADARLADCINRITHDAKASDLWNLTCIAVIEPQDSPEDLASVLGFDPLLGPLNDGDEEFIPWWDWLEHRPGYFELLHTTGTEFAYFILVPDKGPDRSGLATLCRAQPES